MSNGHPEPDPRHRAFLSRAVAPNLYTSTLHPEFIPALVTANLMTPHLWHWAEQSMAGVDVANPTAALQAIHRFLNKNSTTPAATNTPRSGACRRHAT